VVRCRVCGKLFVRDAEIGVDVELGGVNLVVFHGIVEGRRGASAYRDVNICPICRADAMELAAKRIKAVIPKGGAYAEDTARA